MYTWGIISLKGLNICVFPRIRGNFHIQYISWQVTPDPFKISFFINMKKMPSNEYFRVDGRILVMHLQYSIPLRWPYTHRVAMATFWRTFHREGKIGPAWWGGGVHALLFHSIIYHHEQSCGLHSSWEGWYTPHISTLPLYVLCGDGLQCEQIFCYPELKGWFY